MAAFADQHGFAVRFGWGGEDLQRLAPAADVVVIVDVLRFTTAVSVAVNRGAHVLPYRWRDDTAARFAQDHGALLAGPGAGGSGTWSLSPSDLRAVPRGSRLVLPSPNGATLAALARDHDALVVAGCLRNAAAVGRLVGQRSAAVAVIAAGERWPGPGGEHDGPLRPAVEDLLGAGALTCAVADAAGFGPDELSPEARAAVAAYRGVTDLRAQLAECVSGRELRARGRDDDVAAAAELDTDAVPAVLDGLAFGPPRSWRPTGP